MWARVFGVAVLMCGCAVCGGAEDYLNSVKGQRLPGSSEQVGLWWASSGWKVGRDMAIPQTQDQAVTIRAAKNEVEAAQLVIRPRASIKGLTITPGTLTGPSGATLPATCVEILEVRYVNVTRPTDKSAVAGDWPDPLPPLDRPVDLEAGKNQPFWVRVRVPREARAGVYEGELRVTAADLSVTAPLRVEVYDFELPHRMTCVTAFGFDDGLAYRYHGVTDPQQKRQVLEKYLANYSAHHICPYNPAPLDPIRVTWPDVRPPKPKWQGGKPVTNEKHSGQRSLLIFDDRADLNVDASYEPLVPIPEAGLRLRFWYRTAVPEQVFLVTLNHHDSEGKWISGGNNDMTLDGNGHWQEFDHVIKAFPNGARFVQLRLRAARWTDEGEGTGLVWFDDVSLTDPATGKELIEDGGFEPPELPPVDQAKLQVKFDFTAWDKAMERAIDHYGFNSFRLGIPGLGGGTFHSRNEPELLGFAEDTPHYKAMFHSYCSQIQEHLRAKGWLDEAFVYWFDEPDPKDYAFVNNGFAKLKAAAPDINRMLTEQVEPALLGGPNIWCPISDHYRHDLAEQRREHGEKFWWYVCTGPKAPYCTLFIDHPGTEMRVWLWQTWQRKIDGILVWETNYWTSSAAYPDRDRPQNPYEDPMGWTSGYSTPAGKKLPWGNGDGRFVYPPVKAADGRPAAPVLEGPVDSIRWEMLRDGIEDYEYFVILKRLIESKGARIDTASKDRYAALLEVPVEVTKDMTIFTKDPSPIEAHRDRVARAIAELNRE
ncbi:MAG TPA: DUF4091 domain-containing protein [Sedimentisphaerales bacterium]|nr:DUF4091 domain-containing protein [Phycisphaerae bacterium]HON91849.1 DUF4091 domain-containing protein [Sedimentisphaerales bacterium]HQG48108.1 DUF4091 domain-containing protein [Sedimentisphaerales bacterium]